MPPPPSSTAGPAPAHTGPWLVPLLVLVFGMFMSLLDTTIVNVAIPRMQADFGVTTTDIQWIATAYTLTLGVVVPLSGWLGDRFGHAKVYIWSMLGFAATSALCGLAWDLGSMIAFRILQAAPGGILPVVAMAMLYRIVPREKMGMAMGIFGIGVSFAPALGPTLGGYLVEYVDWRLIFYINVPFGLVGVVAAYALLPRAGQSVRLRFDWWGFLTIGTGLFALLLAFSKAEDWHWGSYRILLLLVFGTILLALFVVIELERDDPLIQLRVLRSWPFVNSLLLITVLMVGLQTILFYLPLFLQNGQRMEALPTGVLLLPEALVMGALMPVAGSLYDKFGPRWPAAIGLAIAAYGTYLLCGITANLTQEHVVLWTCVRAAGNGLALMPIMTAGLAAIPAENTSSGTTLNNLVQRVSGSIGLAAMTVIADNRQSQIMADRSGLLPASSSLVQVQQALQEGSTALYGIYQQLSLHVMAAAYSDVFYVCAIVSAVGVFLALDMRKPQPPATAPQPEPTAPAATAHHEPTPDPTPAGDDAREPADAIVRA